MNWNGLLIGLTLISLLIGIANTIWVWLSKGGAATAAKLKEIEVEQAGHGRRIQQVESDIKHLPSKDDLADVRLQLSGMDGKLNTAEAELSSVARTVRRIEDHLLGVKS